MSLTRVQDIGVSYMRLDFEGAYKDCSSELDSDPEASPLLRLK